MICGGYSVDDEVIDLALLFGLHPVVRAELALAFATRDEIRDLAGNVGNFEFLDTPRAVLSGKQRLPGRLNAAAYWGDKSKSGDDDAAH